MGAGGSFFEKDEALEVPDAPDNVKALAGRLSKAHGIHEAILVHGLAALEPCVQRRLNRAITKPLDLACLRAFKAEMEGQDVAPDVQAALDALPAGIKEKVEALLDSLHLCGGYLPRIGVGSAGLYKHFEEGERVHEIAYGYGMRTSRSPHQAMVKVYSNAQACSTAPVPARRCRVLIKPSRASSSPSSSPTKICPTS